MMHVIRGVSAVTVAPISGRYVMAQTEHRERGASFRDFTRRQTGRRGTGEAQSDTPRHSIKFIYGSFGGSAVYGRFYGRCISPPPLLSSSFPPRRVASKTTVVDTRLLFSRCYCIAHPGRCPCRKRVTACCNNALIPRSHRRSYPPTHARP